MRRSSSWLTATALVMAIAISAAHAAATIPPGVQAAVADPARPDADRGRDADRKPAEVIAFAGIKAGDRVFDVLPGGGYFTRLFSKVVGPKGVVYSLPPPRRPDAPANAPDMAAAVTAIAADPGYANVRVIPLDTSAKAPELVDVVWTSLNYHDLHNRPNADLSVFNKFVFDSLKPGGTFIVIDHAAAAGSGARDTGTLHRIDPALVKSEVTSVGFVLEAESDALRNPADDHTTPNRDAGVRGKTDQFVLKFRKPKK